MNSYTEELYLHIYCSLLRQHRKRPFFVFHGYTQGFSRCRTEPRCSFFNCRIQPRGAVRCGTVRKSVFIIKRLGAVRSGADFVFRFHTARGVAVRFELVRFGKTRPIPAPHLNALLDFEGHKGLLTVFVFVKFERCGILLLESYGAVRCGAVWIFIC